MTERKTILIFWVLILSASVAFAGRDRHDSSIEQKISALGMDKKDIVIYISKISHTLTLRIGTVTLKEYACVFGGNPYEDKMYEGDQCTPEGVFHIQSKYPHAKWDKFMWIDYPTQDSRRKFEDNKQQGKLPPNASIGGSIGIHGVPNNRSDLIERSVNWTLGCISLTNEDVDEIYNYVGAGTEVIITR